MKRMSIKKQMILLFILISIFFPAKVLSQLIVGQVAPSLSGIKMIDKEFPDLKNKFVFLDFWATWCTSEVKYLDHLNDLALRFKVNVVFIAVSSESEVQVRSLLQNKLWFNMYFGLDIDQIFYKKFLFENIPVYYFISPQNIILSTGIANEISDIDLNSLIIQNDSTIFKTGTIIVTTKDSIK